MTKNKGFVKKWNHPQSIAKSNLWNPRFSAYPSTIDTSFAPMKRLDVFEPV